MKNLFRLPLLLVLVLALFSGCDDDTDSLKDQLRYKIALRVTGTNLTGLGAEMHYTSVLNTVNNPKAGPSGHDAYAAAIDSTYELGEFGWYDAVEAAIAMRNVNCNTTPKPAPGSRLKVEMLVNGRAVRQATLDAASGSRLGCGGHWVLTLAGTGNEWDD